MHELAICQSLISQLNDIASEHPDSTVSIVHLTIGPLSGVVPQLLEDAFPIASAGTAAEKAILQFHTSDIRIHCPVCNQDSAAQSNKLSCAKCGNWQTELVSGDELILRQVELEKENNTPLH